MFESYIQKLKNIKIPSLVLIENLFDGDNGKLLTSHQPIIFTPGIISKFLYKDLNKTIVYNDSDRAEFRFLGKNLNFDKTLEFLNEDDIDQFKNFINYCSEYYSNFIENRQTKENISIFLDILNREKADFFPFFWNNILVKYLQCFNFNVDFEVNFVSRFDFSDILDWVVNNYQFFWNLYNEGISIFRKNLGFYPIKELEHGELPFWVYIQNERRTMFYRDGQLTDSSGEKINLNELKTKLRPKAVIWAMYRRYFMDKINDILGVGSSYYTFVADYIANNLLKMDPPPTYVVSVSITLDNQQFRINRLKSLVNAFKSSIFDNPEKLHKILLSLKEFESIIDISDLEKIVNKVNHYIDRGILEQKKKLINQINDPNNRKIKKELTAKIKYLNQMMVDQIIDHLQELEKITDMINFQIERIFEEYKYLNSRDLPFFFLDPQDITKLLYVTK